MSVGRAWLGKGSEGGTTCLTCLNEDVLETRKRQARCTCREGGFVILNSL